MTPSVLGIGIFWRERMASLAMRLSRVVCGEAIAAQCVLARTDRFQVRWSDAMPHPAKMIKLESWRDGAVNRFVGPSVSPNTAVYLPSYAEVAVAVRDDASGPDPAVSDVGAMRRDRPIFIDLRPETLGTSHFMLSIWRSMMRLTSSASEIPSRLASRFRNWRCGSVNEIICLTMIFSIATDFPCQFLQIRKCSQSERDSLIVLASLSKPSSLVGHIYYLVGELERIVKGTIKKCEIAFGLSDGLSDLGTSHFHTVSIPRGIQCHA